MISRLDNENTKVAHMIYSVFQASYAVEAEILKAIDFPPLQRTLDEYLHTDTEFYGLLEAKELAAVVEIKYSVGITHIQSMVVNPRYFRRGLASQLMDFVLDNCNSDLMTVETGAANVPAIKLYEKFGFKHIEQSYISQGINKVKFEKRPNPAFSS